MTSDVSTCAHCRAPVRAGTQSCESCGSALSGVDVVTPTIDPMSGRTVDGFIIGARVGEDGVGAIYRAEQTAIGRKALVKLIHPWLSRDAAVARRLEQEARAAARLQNPHIASFHKHGRMADGTLFLAVEELQGVTLTELLRAEGRLEPARAVAIATQCLEALAEAHRRGVIHGAFEPSKIMLVPRGGPDFVKLVDVGVSLLQSTHENERVGGRPRPGSPQYMAPEQFTDDAVDHRSDLYALGLVLYEMLAGHPAFLERSAQAYRQRHLHDSPSALTRASPGIGVPPAVEACVMRALAKSPHHRPQSADAFADELWAALMATVERSDLPVPSPRRRRRSRAIVVASVGALVGSALGLGLGAYLFLRPTAPAEVGSAPGAEHPASAGPASSMSRTTVSATTVSGLEAELSHVVTSLGFPPQAIELSLQAYRDAAAAPPPGVETTAYRKVLLTRLIAAWRAPDGEGAEAARSLDELEAAFLTMASPLAPDTRRTMLNRLKQAARNEPDARATTRSQLVRWIDAYGENGDFEDEEAQIEIVALESDG